ncbi:nuclease-related domain-containing protein [Nocardia sp. NPDC020380]|uniref:nuclease-related domain-containing protein n=1 Tax=Nocardia sp. NPDC020380 TaxID=3364309 RepID=UPI00379F63E5
MLVKVLSDHGRDQLQVAGQQLENASMNHAAWQSYYDQACDELLAARRAKPLWRRMLALSSVQERDAQDRVDGATRQVALSESNAQDAYNRVQQQNAGVYGEELLAWGLSGLANEWVLLRGYRNRRGETDGVLVGPQGVWAIEVKRRRVQLHAVGDQWWYRRLSARGQVYESEWAVDSAGRSWPRQVNDIASDLEGWLHRNGHRIRVRTAVMLMHEQAQIVESASSAVDFVGTDPALLIEVIVQIPPTPLDQDACTDIARLIERDHRFHASRRRH